MAPVTSQSPLTPEQRRFDEIIRGKKQFNGKPFSHWQAAANELVIESIIRAALHGTDERSLIGHIVRRRLMEIAHTENTTLAQKILHKRDRILGGFAVMLTRILG